MKARLLLSLFGAVIAFSQQIRGEEPAKREQALEAFAVEGWITSLDHQLERLRLIKDLDEAWVTERHHNLYFRTFVCWLACEGDEALFKDEKAKRVLLAYVVGINQQLTGKLRNADDPVLATEGLKEKINDPTAVAKYLKQAVSLSGFEMSSPHLASLQAYKGAVAKFRAYLASQAKDKPTK